MKQETKLRIFSGIVSLFFGIVSLCILIHFFYYNWQNDIPMPSWLFLCGLWAPLLMLFAILPPKKVRTPDYSKVFSVIGIFFSLCSFAIYFSWFLGIWSNTDFTFFIFFIIAYYLAFLSGYKNR